MFLRRILLFLLFVVSAFDSSAQKKEEYKQPRVLILLDGSSSMVNEWTKGKKRFDVAGEIILSLMDSIYRLNRDVEFGLRLYGHQHGVPENNCYDTRREVMFSKDNYTQMSLRLASIQPIGVSPIAYSLKVAAENDFVNDRDYVYSLVLITDGGESCGGDICDVVKTLIEKKIQFKPYIISLVDYAPLKSQYDCMGNYLTVATQHDVVPAIHAIADAYRKVLAVPVVKPKLLQTSNIPSPSIQKITVPSVKVQVTNEPETTIVAKKPELKTVVESKPIPEKEVEVKPQEKKEPAPVVVNNTSSNIKVNTSFFDKEIIKSVWHHNYDRVNYNLFWGSTLPKKRTVPQFPLPAREEEPKPVTTASKPPATRAPATTTVIKPAATVVKPEIKEANYSMIMEPAAETKLEVYFTDGKGKFYTSTPPVQLVDAATGMEVKRFYRTVDANGNPDPQKVTAGNYNMIIGKTGNYKAKSITIQAANTNKVTVVVSKGTLLFRYENNSKRPVNEFSAAVRKTFEANTNVFQKCTEEREYEPGNYHIQINTLPMMIRNIDLDFGYSYTIEIPEPGFVQFTNTNSIGRVTLWAPLGDQFARFHGMDLNGNAQSQNLRLLPGVYEVHWKRNPTHPNEPEVVQKFYVKSNQTTELELQ